MHVSTSDKSTQKISWLMLFPLVFFLFFDFVQLNMMNSTGHFIMPYVDNNINKLGFISSLFFYSNLVFLLPAGHCLDKYPLRWVLAFSLMVSVIGLFIFSIIPSHSTLIIWRLLTGIGGAFSYISCIKIISRYFPKRLWGLLIGLTGIVIMVAGIFSQYPLAFLYQTIGLNYTLIVDALFGLMTVALILIFMKNNKAIGNVMPTKNAKNKKVYFKKINWLIASFAALTNFPLFVLGAVWGSNYLIQAHSLSLKDSLVISSMIFFGNIFGAPLLGTLSDYLKNRRHLMLLSAIIYLLSMMYIIFYPTANFYGFLVSFFILGFSTGAQTLAYASIIDNNALLETAKATSLVSMLSIGGAAIIQPLFGYLSSVTQPPNYNYGICILLFAAVVSIVLAVYMNRTTVAKTVLQQLT